MKKFFLFLSLTAASAVLAEDVPFWGADSSNATNVVSTVSVSLDATVESRAFTWFFSEGIDFSSCPVGFMLLFR